MKKVVIFIFAVAIMILGYSTVAEVKGPLFHADSFSDYGVDESECLIFKDYQVGEGIVSLNDGITCPAKFGALSWEGSGYYEAIHKNGLDTHGLVDRSGRIVIPFEYAAFDVYSENWVGAIKLEETETEGDYGSGFFGTGKQYNITQVDIWYIPENEIIGSLNRMQYKKARTVCQDTHLLVLDRVDRLTLYGKSFETKQHLFKSFDDPEIINYQPNKLSASALTSCVTCQKIIDLDAVSTSTDFRSNYQYTFVRVEIAGENGNKTKYGVIGPDYDLLTDFELETIDQVFENRYVLTHNNNSKYGVYDLIDKRYVVPNTYNKIQSKNNCIVFDGYICVKNYNKYGFVDANNIVTCPFEYEERNVDKYLGATISYKDGNNLILVSADGKETNLTEMNIEEVNYPRDGSDGRIIPVKGENGKHGIVDWHGNILVDLVLNYAPNVYKDGYMVYDGDLYHITI